MATLLILVLIVSAAFLAVVVLLAPRILLRPQLKERLSELRDEIYDARRSGEFPYEDQAIDTLIRRIDSFVRVADEFTPVRIAVALWLSRNMSDLDKQKIRALSEPDTTGLSADQLLHYQAVEKRFVVLASSMPILGTWTGIIAFTAVTPFILVGIAITLLSTRAQNRTSHLMSEQRLRVEGIAYEFSLDPKNRSHRGHLIGV